MWTTAEDELIFNKFQEVGPKWVQISAFLPGRTGNDVKNRWHKHISRRVRQREEAGAQNTEEFETENGRSDQGTDPQERQNEISRQRVESWPFLKNVLN
jgi:hypothetical protein